MSSAGGLMRRVGVAVALGLLGLTMVVWGLERLSLINFAIMLDGEDVATPLGVYFTLFIGLALVNLSTFWAVKQWSSYLREHPDAPQLPVWALVVLIVVPGALLVTSIATHAGYIRGLDEVPMDPNPGFVGFQVTMAAMVIIALVLLGVRWAPGYKRGPQLQAS